MTTAADPESPDATSGPAARYRVGIDLGTTHSAVAYVDTVQADGRVRDFPIPQVVAAGETDVRPVLPSFLYQPVPGEFAMGALASPAVPGGEYVVGSFARDQGARTPGRLVVSAKSWLCHPGVNRTAPLLPWQAASDVTRVSPVEASTRYLAQLRAAWDAAFPGHLLADQDVVVTVPASFDEVARELTVEAAAKAGLARLTLLEEPQAAFYAWMAGQGTNADDAIPAAAGQVTLICDVGGGTTDFTLIEARAEGGGRIRFHRLAVGDHLILGGDNMDLALAHLVEGRMSGGGKLDPRRWELLVQACRRAKETLLGEGAPERASVSVAGGSRVIGGALQAELTRGEVESLLVDGFFPRVAYGERPVASRSGFREFGLPYAADAAITRHLAAFLATQAGIGSGSGEASIPAFPDRVLFNGGVFESAVLRERLLEVLNGWRREVEGSEAASVTALPHDRLDLAVARGAAYAAWLRRRPERRIAAGLARAYYLRVGRVGETVPTAVCLAPAGLEEGPELVLPQRFVLRLHEPVEFGVYRSSTRVRDRAGELVEIDPNQMSSLPPVRTVVGSGKSREAGSTEVQVHARLTELGTLDVRCVQVGQGRSWKLEFDVRGTRAAGEPGSGAAVGGGPSVDEGVVEQCRQIIRRVFEGPARGGDADPSTLVRRLEAATGLGRDQWPLALLRALWSQLIDLAGGRRRGVIHEARWLNLLGFALRPGFGYAVDDWRVLRTWRLFSSGVSFPKNEMCRAEWSILWRRIAGGLGPGHQRALADSYLDQYRPRPGRKTFFGSHETAEIWRLLGALELLPVPTKVELGNFLAERLEQRLEPTLARAGWWAWGRLGARVPLNGPLNALVPIEVAEAWIGRCLDRSPSDPEALFAVAQMARRTGDRYRDLADAIRSKAAEWLERNGAGAEVVTQVREGGDWESTQEAHVFGEALPPGLHLPAD